MESPEDDYFCDTVGWTGKSTGPASPDGWIALSGNANDQYHGQYLAADGPGFEYSDGCWTFTVTVTHTTHIGESVLIDDDVSWDLDFEDRGTGYAQKFADNLSLLSQCCGFRYSQYTWNVYITEIKFVQRLLTQVFPLSFEFVPSGQIVFDQVTPSS